MATFSRVISALCLLLMTASPAWARVINLETAAPLADRSDSSVTRALQGALDDCVHRAAALGLAWMRIEDAVLQADRVVVQVVATDEADEARRQNMMPVWDL